MLPRSPDLLLSSYDFELPPDLIAQVPAARREDSRLLVAPIHGGGVAHRRFVDLPFLLSPGDLLVVNDTRVLAARLTAVRPSGGRVRLLALEARADGAWRCLVKPSARIPEGELLTLVRRSDGTEGPRVVVGPRTEDGARLVAAEGDDLAALMPLWGEMPLPPYIRRDEGPQGGDAARYQTVFAAHDGAVAAPTAGLHFSAPVLETLQDRGVGIAPVTLHVGAGTFAPVREEELVDHAMHSERYSVPGATAEQVIATLGRGSRVVCVGTTSARSLESWHRAGRPADGAFRETSLFLRPGDPPELTFSLLTNFHLPRSTLLVLVASLLGRTRALSLYAQAVAERYRFFSYGDACLFL